MSEMVERGTQAIIAAMGDTYGCYSERCTCIDAAETLKCRMGVTADELARAVIEAMLNPTAEMIAAGAATFILENELRDDLQIAAAYPAMIDAALK